MAKTFKVICPDQVTITVESESFAKLVENIREQVTINEQFRLVSTVSVGHEVSNETWETTPDRSVLHVQVIAGENIFALLFNLT